MTELLKGLQLKDPTSSLSDSTLPNANPTFYNLVRLLPRCWVSNMDQPFQGLTSG